MVNKIARVLVIIGALNWGLEALNFNIVNKLLGSWPIAETIVYALVGISALWLVVKSLMGRKAAAPQM